MLQLVHRVLRMVVDSEVGALGGDPSVPGEIFCRDFLALFIVDQVLAKLPGCVL
jgi:hypothetical protein